MPFIFSCRECGRVLYEDPSPILKDKDTTATYFERILERLGPNCPSCGHQLCLPPSTIEISIWNGHCINGNKKEVNQNIFT